MFVGKKGNYIWKINRKIETRLELYAQHYRIIDSRDRFGAGREAAALPPPSPLLEGIGPVGLVAAVVEATLVSQGRQGIPGRFPAVARVSSRVYRTRSTGAEGRAAGLPSVGMPEPLSARGFPDAAGTSARHTFTRDQYIIYRARSV